MPFPNDSSNLRKHGHQALERHHGRWSTPGRGRGGCGSSIGMVVKPIHHAHGRAREAPPHPCFALSSRALFVVCCIVVDLRSKGQGKVTPLSTIEGGRVGGRLKRELLSTSRRSHAACDDRDHDRE